HPFGTDDLGRDVAARVVVATPISLAIGLVAAGVSLVVGFGIGAAAGYFGGATDLLLSRLIEVVLWFPVLFLLLALAAFLPPCLPIICWPKASDTRRPKQGERDAGTRCPLPRLLRSPDQRAFRRPLPSAPARRPRHRRHPRERREETALLGRGAPRDDPRDRRRRLRRIGPVVLRPPGGLRRGDRRDAPRPGPPRDLRLRVRAADGLDESPPGALDRDGVPDGEGGVLVRLEPSRQGGGAARRRRLRARPRAGPASPGSAASALVTGNGRVVETELRVRYSETDRMGIVYHGAY